MIKVGVVGATGYAGSHLVSRLLRHPEVDLRYLASVNYSGDKYSDVFSNFHNISDAICVDEDLELFTRELDLIFTATPQGYLGGMLTLDMLEKARFIDLSADYRITDRAVYENWYGIEHKSPTLIQEAVYGLCEVNRDKLKGARLVANPGCYPTCSLLSIYPCVKEKLIDVSTIIIDAKSGTSGAGRGAKRDTLYCEVNENIKAYGVGSHRHIPEIEEQLSIIAREETVISFTPHLVPMNRGILVTAYASLVADDKGNYPTTDRIREIYHNYYEKENFVRVLELDKNPETRWVNGSNYVDVNIKVDNRTGRVVMMGAIDNLVKGAAGQAIQNMNIMYSLKEDMGLEATPMFP